MSRKVPMELVVMLGVVALWFALNRWILPKLGVPT